MEAATTLTGALVVFLIGFVNVDWKVWGNLAIVLMTGFTSILLYMMGITHDIWMAYSGNITFWVKIQILIRKLNYFIISNFLDLNIQEQLPILVQKLKYFFKQSFVKIEFLD